MQRSIKQGIDDLKKMLEDMEQEVFAILQVIKQELTSPKAQEVKAISEKHAHISKTKTEIDKLTSTLIALQQPVAIDLRYIIGCMKIAVELERIANHSVLIIKSINVLKKILHHEKLKRKFVKLTYSKHAELALHLFEGTWQSFSEGNTLIAKGVCNTKAEVIEHSRKKVKELMIQMSKKKIPLKAGIELIQVSKELDRIISLSTNIAEDVIYIYEVSLD